MNIYCKEGTCWYRCYEDNLCSYYTQVIGGWPYSSLHWHCCHYSFNMDKQGLPEVLDFDQISLLAFRQACE